MLKSYKERQFLVFELPDGKNVKYNLATGESIGKSGRVVKDICTQLRGYNLLEVIDSFDGNYKSFLKFVDSRVNTSQTRYSWRNHRVNKITNIGTFLKRVGEFSKYEQYFSSGLTRIEYPLSYEFKEVPKGLFKLCRENNYELTNNLIKLYRDNPNLINNLMGEKYVTLEHSDIWSLLTSSNYTKRNAKSYFLDLISRYNYNAISLIKFIDNLMTYEALDDLCGIINELHDYVRMVSLISDKYEKYPKNFLTTHRIATRNYNRLKRTFNEELFAKRVDEKLEYKGEEYCVIYPRTTQEIKDEAINLNHCVASYIDKVIDGKCHILFLRKKDSKNTSLITMELRGCEIVQARGKFNRETTESEKEFIELYENKLIKKINLGGK